MTYRLEVRYANRSGGWSWRKLRGSVNFLLRDAAEAYGQKYLRAGWWRVTETKEG